MKTRHLAVLAGAQFALALSPVFGADPAPKGKSDIMPPPRRQPTVDAAERLSRPPTPAPVAADLKSPFNPTEFNKPDPDDPNAPKRPAAGTPAAATPPPAATGDKELLETLAARIPSTGTLNFGGKPLLIVGKNRLEIGTKFTVAFNGQDYELELVAIDRTTFTLRYRGEETTRPIRSVK